MKVLVAVGSKYGATREVGETITEVLRGRGFDTDFSDACDVSSVRFYDAVILGSAVYGGLWRKDSAALVRDQADLLKERAVWMFSVGMTSVTHPDQPLDEAEELADKINAREHKRFDGRLLIEKLNVGEKALVRTLNAPLGDFRDFDEIRAWADDIGVILQKQAFV